MLGIQLHSCVELVAVPEGESDFPLGELEARHGSSGYRALQVLLCGRDGKYQNDPSCVIAVPRLRSRFDA